MPFLTSVDHPDPGMELLMCPALTGGFFTSSTTWEADIRKILSKGTLLCKYSNKTFAMWVMQTVLIMYEPMVLLSLFSHVRLCATP